MNEEGSIGGRPRWYRNTPLLVGVVLMMLGLGNWITGEIRATEHREVAVRTGGEAGGEKGGSPSPEEVDLARFRMDFYHVVALGGRVLTAAGALLAALGAARQIRATAGKA